MVEFNTNMTRQMKYIYSLILMLLFTIDCSAQFDFDENIIVFDSLFSKAEGAYLESDLTEENWELKPINAFDKFFENYDSLVARFGDDLLLFDSINDRVMQAHYYYYAIMNYLFSQGRQYSNNQLYEFNNSLNNHVLSYIQLQEKCSLHYNVDEFIYKEACKLYSLRATGYLHQMNENDSLNDFWIPTCLKYCDSAILFYEASNISINTINDIKSTAYIDTIFATRCVLRKYFPQWQKKWEKIDDAIYNLLDSLPEERDDGLEKYLYDILEPLYIDTGYKADYVIRDSLQWQKRRYQIGEFVYNHPEDIYEGLNYVHYTGEWLINNKRYEDFLDFFDSIYPRFRNDIEIQKMLFKSYYSLGYYGQGLWSYGNWLGKDTAECHPEEIVAWVYYLNGLYNDAKGMCDYVLATDESNVDMLTIRGSCHKKLGDSKKAENDFHEVLSLNKKTREPTDAFVYAMLGKTKEAIRIAEKRIGEADSLLKQRSPIDSVLASIVFIDQAQVYSIAGKQRKAKKSIRKALTISPDPFTLSFALSVPYIESLHEEIFLFVKEHQDEYRKKYGDTLKYIEPEIFDTIIICPSPMTIRCTVNGHEVHMLYDTGADKVLISKELASLMEKEGTLTSKDYTGEMVITKNADGGRSLKDEILIRSLKIGNVELRNVPALIAERDGITMLFGRSAINLLDRATPPNEKGVCSFKQIRCRRK